MNRQRSLCGDLMLREGMKLRQGRTLYCIVCIEVGIFSSLEVETFPSRF
jgi:hypothetical protein